MYNSKCLSIERIKEYEELVKHLKRDKLIQVG